MPLIGSGAGAFPDIPAHDLIIDPNNSSKLYVGTDIGVFVSLDAGATWMQDDDPFASPISKAGSSCDLNCALDCVDS